MEIAIGLLKHIVSALDEYSQTHAKVVIVPNQDADSADIDFELENGRVKTILKLYLKPEE